MKPFKQILCILLCATICLLALYFCFAQAMRNRKSPYVRFKNEIPGSYRIGFTNLETETKSENIAIEGEIPSWLSGTLMRTGPAQFTSGASWISNWFDGLSMIYAFTFKNGSVSYENRFLRTDDYNHMLETGSIHHSGYISDGPFNLFEKISDLLTRPKSPRHQSPNANVAIALLEHNPVALTEIPYPVAFESKTLTTIGPVKYQDTLEQNFIQITAHPHYDPRTKEQIGYFTQFGKNSSYTVYRIKDGTTTREPIASIPCTHPSYMHSFSLTQHYIILIEIPFIASIWKLMFANYGYLKNFNWQPERGTSFVVIDREEKRVIGTYKTEPFFMFHTVNAYEDDGTLILDLIRYPTADIPFHSYLEELLAPRNAQEIDNSIRPRLTRYSIDILKNQVASRDITDKLVEFPRINYERNNAVDYTYLYACGKASYSETPVYCLEKLLKINVKTGETKEWSRKNCYPGEPVFIPRPTGIQEDDGVVLSVVLDADAGNSFLVVLDAKSFTQQAKIPLDHHVPFGLHGLFLSSDRSAV